MYTIENEFLKASFKSRCGELASLINKNSGLEHMWQANQSIWGWHAPILFPIVGGLKNDILHIEDESFTMGRHGFFRNTTPEVEEHSERHIVFLLKSSELTRPLYPYEFEFRLHFELNGMSLLQRFIVTNTDSKPIYFALGGHPGFNVPFYESESYSDYYLEFEHSEQLHRQLLNEDGLFNGKTEQVKTDENTLPLSYDLFANDAMVFKEIKSRIVTIRSRKHERSLTVSFPNFPYLGLWAKHKANFVCIEPWIGCADSVDGHKHIRDKELVQDISSNESFSAEFTITIC